MTVISGKKAQFYICSFPSLPLTAPEPCTNVGADLTNYQITAVGHRMVDKNGTAITLEFSVNAGVNWNPVVNSGTSAYTIQWIGGWVRFGVAQAAGTMIRFATGSYFAMAAAGGAHLADMKSKLSIFDVTDFTAAAAGWKVHDSNIIESAWTMRRWSLDSFYHDNYDKLFVIQLYANVISGTRFESYAWLTDDSVDAAQAQLLDEPLVFKGEGAWSFVP